MDIRCRCCDEPWDAEYLRHEMAWWECRACGQSLTRYSDATFHVCRNPWQAPEETACTRCRGEQHDPELTIESADNGQIPPQVAVGYQKHSGTGSGWLDFVACGLGCPACYGRDLQPRELTAAEVDDISVATEGLLDGDLL